jgi:hypothetical protein
LNHKFGNDSVFWISYQDLLRKYQHFDRTRLFRDSPEWRITQKWISVEVPWKSEFEQKFVISLKKESPVVLVLSQLDERYFDGLQGQYRFRLQFRLHELNSPAENDYIVRSHGNYLMSRSVVAELKELPAGTYSVFIMVIGDRDSRALSVEEVVKIQCRRKTHNEKLAQVGMAYDFAHRKGASYTESKMAAQKLRDKAKAKEERSAARKKHWEKRHLSRDIIRKQERKNKEKRERKEAKVAAKAKESEEKSVQTEEVKVDIRTQDQGIQTEERNMATSSAEFERTIIPSVPESQGSDRDKGIQADDTSTVGSQCTPVTPKSNSRSGSPQPDFNLISSMNHERRPSPPPHFHREKERGQGRKELPDQHRHQHQSYIISEGESSASPISDFDDMYSDDDLSLKPRPLPISGGPPGGKSKKAGDSDDEDESEPWNAICIVGLRVYSQDEGLELRILEDDNVTEIEKVQVMEKDEAGTDADDEDADEEEALALRADDSKPEASQVQEDDVSKVKLKA